MVLVKVLCEWEWWSRLGWWSWPGGGGDWVTMAMARHDRTSQKEQGRTRTEQDKTG
jgi:hypothetical protein